MDRVYRNGAEPHARSVPCRDDGAMVGIVVSHSAQLAEGVVERARQVAGPDPAKVALLRRACGRGITLKREASGGARRRG